MTHIALVEQLDGKSTDWLDQVSAEQYRAGLRAESQDTSVFRR